MREAILGEIEKARAQARDLKASREAQIQLRLKDADALDSLKAFGAELASIFSVSQIDLQLDAFSCRSAWTITVSKAEGAKCARCWIFKNDIGADSRWPEVCKRCADVLAEAVPA